LAHQDELDLALRHAADDSDPGAGRRIVLEMATHRVYLEQGQKRTFASALDWPGWSRVGRDEAGALAALVAAGPRYASVVPVALGFAAPGEASELRVDARVQGGAATDFGVPGEPAPDDDRPLSHDEAERLATLLEAAWSAFDRIAEAAEGIELRKGPRGGGRDLDGIVEHVVGAEEAYLRQLGRRPPDRDGRVPGDAWRVIRPVAVESVHVRVRGEEPQDATRVKRRWSVRYYARRAAWHVLDHAWEIEDRAIRMG
jgi:hypothetical protein